MLALSDVFGGLHLLRRVRGVGAAAGGVQFALEPAQAGVDDEVVLVAQECFAAEGVRPGVLECLADSELAREEGVDFWGGMPDAGLYVEDGDAGLAGGGETRAAEELDGSGVGLGVVGADEGEDGGFAGAWCG